MPGSRRRSGIGRRKECRLSGAAGRELDVASGLKINAEFELTVTLCVDASCMASLLTKKSRCSCMLFGFFVEPSGGQRLSNSEGGGLSKFCLVAASQNLNKKRLLI